MSVHGLFRVDGYGSFGYTFLFIILDLLISRRLSPQMSFAQEI